MSVQIRVSCSDSLKGKLHLLLDAQKNFYIQTCKTLFGTREEGLYLCPSSPTPRTLPDSPSAQDMLSNEWNCNEYVNKVSWTDEVRQVQVQERTCFPLHTPSSNLTTLDSLEGKDSRRSSENRKCPLWITTETMICHFGYIAKFNP